MIKDMKKDTSNKALDRLNRSLASSNPNYPRIEVVEIISPSGNNRGKRLRVRCHCGEEFEARKSDIMSGHTTSCGCERGKRRPLIKPKSKIASLRVTSKPTLKPKPPPIIEEEENDEDLAEEFLEAALEKHNHMQPEWFAASLGYKLHELREMPYEDLKDLFEENGVT